MVIRNSLNKPMIAGTLAGIFLFFLSAQVFGAGSTRLETAPAFTVDHSEVFVIRDPGNGESFCPTIKNLVSGYLQNQLLRLPVTKVAHASESTFSTIEHNVFYVFISSLAP